MSGFGRNVIPRRAHKERAQPGGRIGRHGLLEKKRDYKVRAKHANRRAHRLKLLREKASFRNPDEFYYGMIGTKTSGGIARKTRDVDDALAGRDGETRLLAASRDAAYVKMKHATERGKLGKLDKGLHFLGLAHNAKRSHTIFVEDDADIELVEKRANEEVSQSTEHLAERAYAQYERRSERVEKLAMAMQDIDTEKKLFGKGARFKVRNADERAGTPAVFKWRQQRKR